MKHRKCSNCGAQNLTSDFSCRECGAILELPVSPAANIGDTKKDGNEVKFALEEGESTIAEFSPYQGAKKYILRRAIISSLLVAAIGTLFSLVQLIGNGLNSGTLGLFVITVSIEFAALFLFPAYSVMSFYKRLFSDTHYMITDRRVIFQDIGRRRKLMVREIPVSDIRNVRIVKKSRRSANHYSSVLVIGKSSVHEIEDIIKKKFKTGGETIRLSPDPLSGEGMSGKSNFKVKRRVKLKNRIPLVMRFLSEQDSERAKSLLESMV